MSNLFSPKVPKPKPPEPPPPPITVDDTLVNDQTLDRARKKKGRASTVLGGGGSTSTGTKTALGS